MTREPGYDWNHARVGRRPLMVFPGIAKSASHWYLWEARRRLSQALLWCDAVVTIGVGLSRSDGDIVRLLEHAMWHRLERQGGQLRAAILVDLEPGMERTRAIQRLQEALRPEQLLPSTSGFDAWVRNEAWVGDLDRILAPAEPAARAAQA